MGGYSLLASRRAGAEGRVFAFEPDPNNFARLVKQIGHSTNVQPVQKAIAAASGESLLFLDSFHAGHTLVDGRVGERGISVGVTSLDDFVRDHSLPGIDVVKLDIEGAEEQAFSGGQRINRIVSAVRFRGGSARLCLPHISSGSELTTPPDLKSA